jgi:predicted GTPase
MSAPVHLTFWSQVHNTPEGHVTRDYKEGLARLSDLRFKVVDTSGQHRMVNSACRDC